MVQQNPGLANPEISKIIGEQWRDEPEERKNQWKLLAEEEKQRHQRQYPDYRYQPRRGNKGAGAQAARPAAAPGEDPNRCPKCGGRYIATPRTPSTPFTTPTAAKPSGNPPHGGPAPAPPLPLPPTHPTGQSLSLVPPPRSEMSSSSSSSSSSSRATRLHWGGSQGGGGSLYDIREDVYESMVSSPEAKRRRYNAAGSYHNFHALPSPPPPPPPPPPTATAMTQFAAPGYPHAPHPHTHTHPPHARQSSVSGPATPGHAPPPPPPPPPPLPGPSSMLLPRRSPGPMPPPPPPRPPHYAQQPPARSPGFDESLRLPPLLQTHLPTSPESEHGRGGGEGGGPGVVGAATTTTTTTTTTTVPLSSTFSSYGSSSLAAHHREQREAQAQAYAQAYAQAQAQAQARSVEAMVMSISFVNKLRVLERISPPLAAEPARGPVIAIEGPDARLLRLVAGVVERALAAASAEWVVRCWEDSSAAAADPRDGDENNNDNNNSAANNNNNNNNDNSDNSDNNDNDNPLTGYLRTITEWHAKSAEIVAFITGAAPASQNHRLSSSSSSASTATTSITTAAATNSDDATLQQQQEQQHKEQQQQKQQPTTAAARLPIALLPAGFALTLADRHACAVPIADAYAPVDHWQWMATLWRGVVGADLVVHVAPASPLPCSSSSTPPLPPRSGGLGGLAGEDGPPGVEVRGEGLIVVRVPAGNASNNAAGSEGVVDEKMERRLGFEVVEWVRSGGWGSGRAVMGGMEF